MGVLITATAGLCLWIVLWALNMSGFDAILIEREADSALDIERRLAHVKAGRRTRIEARVKALGKKKDPGPLFAEVESA